MQLLKNRHLILAMFVAPTLAVIAYFAVDYAVSEKPQPAQPGNTYKLAGNSNCRYQSGACTLKNGDIEVYVKADRLDETHVELQLASATPIQHALVSAVTAGLESEPLVLPAGSDRDDRRSVILQLQQPAQSTLRLALTIAGSTYYAETTAVFVDYATSFSRENFEH